MTFVMWLSFVPAENGKFYNNSIKILWQEIYFFGISIEKHRSFDSLDLADNAFLWYR